MLPDTLQKAAVIARARQLTDFKWKPVRDVPSYTRTEGNIVLPAGVELTGFPYSSTEQHDKFFTENVLVETFLSAIPNPYSKLYQPGTAAFNSCCYGIVCNGLARYALGINMRVSTLCWTMIDGMRLVAEKKQFVANDIQLCDVLLRVYEKDLTNHVALITGLVKNDDGDVVEIEVSEATRPVCVRRKFTVESFFEMFELYALYRYDYLDNVPLLDESVEELIQNNPYSDTPKVAVDNGNKSNYLEGEETIISVCIEGKDILQVCKDGEVIEEIVVTDKAALPRCFEKGYYKLILKNDGAAVEFAVNKAEISYKVENNQITVFADSCDKDSEILYMDFRIQGKGWASLAKFEELTDDEKKNGVITRTIPSNGENFKVYFKNKYGVWVHQMTPIEK